MPLRELSKEKRVLWVERIFARMSAMYGRLFAEMWVGTDLAEVKDVWADDLAPFCGAQIAWAMEQCKARELPPTLPMFRGLCQQAPRPEVPALPAPKVSRDVALERAKELRRAADRVASRPVGSTAWAETPPASPRGSVWERWIIELAEAGEPRFVAILAQHVGAGVIRAPRALAALEAAGHETDTRAVA
ncbi:hypothetical protein [Pseudothauera rhizosphaerae]|uniref:Uncharacterized protein n=1 Tax=Pseudothauera rhizosphaerae TaxID=2565932 RepID=A0A4S4AAJ3_9RHOO|nr:hypothetical protein [Pseudothauera rhizosphaerae]THF55935.1 hypothetical protein E6O51_20325 [Pseudothauera rhizosphaerae]